MEGLVGQRGHRFPWLIADIGFAYVEWIFGQKNLSIYCYA